MTSTERTVYVYDLVVGKRAAHAPIASLTDLAAVFMTQYNSGDCKHALNNGTLIYRIGDIAIDSQSGVLTLLIRRADQNAPEAAYSHIETGQLRFASKTDDEGGDTGAHLTISTIQEVNKPGTYLCMFEGVPGISHRPVKSLLNSIIRNACQCNPSLFEYEDPSGARTANGSPNGAPKRKTFVPHLDLRGHMSDDLIRELERGTVEGIELVKSQLTTQLGGDPYLVHDEFSLKVKAVNIPATNRFSRIMTAMQRQKSFKTGRITFKNEDGRVRSIVYNLDTGTPEQASYVKSFPVNGITPPLAQSSLAIAPQLTTAMTTELIRQRRI